MGNQIEKQYNIKQKPLKLPGSYNFLRFIHHPTEDLSLIVVKSPHKATPIPSTLILPIKQIKQLSQSSDTIAVCQKCLPLALVKPKSQTQMRILMHKILKSSSEIGRCFFYMGRVMLWCEQKRGFCSNSPQQVQFGKFHQKSKVFASGIALMNFLYCVYDADIVVRDKKIKKQNSSKNSSLTTKQKVRQKMQPKGNNANESLPLEIKLFFEPKDKKQYYQALYSIQNKLNQSQFWKLISQGLKELLLNMVSEDPDKRINLDTILNIPYFIQSNQLRLYSTLADDLDSMSPKQAKLFMTTLEVLIKQGLTIEQCLMQDFFRPVLCSMVTYNPRQGKQNDYLIPMVLSILIQIDNPPIEIISQGFKKSHSKNIPIIRLILNKKQRLLHLLPTQNFDIILSRALFSSFQSQPLTQMAILCIPFAMRSIKYANYKKQIQFVLINKILINSSVKESILLDALKCMIYLIKENIITSPSKLEALTFRPIKFGIQLNFHILYVYGLMIECFQPLELLQKMMPKLQLYLNEPELYDEIFVVAKRCVDRILQRLYEQRKINPKEMVQLQKSQNYFDMRDDPSVVDINIEQTKVILKKQIQKHQIERLMWTTNLLV